MRHVVFYSYSYEKMIEVTSVVKEMFVLMVLMKYVLHCLIVCRQREILVWHNVMMVIEIMIDDELDFDLNQFL
jgi:hypothetical protein